MAAHLDLRNDAEFFEALGNFLKQPESVEYCVVAIDIEHFKFINEWYGFDQGDEILKELGRRIYRYCDHDNWLTGYFGNDDFMLVVPDDEDILNDLYNRTKRLVDSQFERINFVINIGACSIGKTPGAKAEDLCNYAQIACCLQLDDKKENISRFDTKDLDRIKHETQTLSEIEDGIKAGQFTFHLQPQLNSETRTIIGMEALVRWNHPTRGLVFPGEFIPLLERTGQIVDLDTYIWEQVCIELEKRIKAGKNMVPVSINVSMADIQEIDVPGYLEKLCEQYDIPRKLLKVEITESMMAQNMELVATVTGELRRMGFSILMDDFGSGYSSLNMLKDTNIDVIKLDMKLIDLNNENFEKGQQIVESVIDMAHQLGLPVVAEGVETQEQLRMLQSLDCIYTQGFRFFRPMEIAAAAALLDQPNVDAYWDVALDSQNRKPKEIHKQFVESIMQQTCGMLVDSFLMLARLNLITGNFEMLKRSPILPETGSGNLGNLEDYAKRIQQAGIVNPAYLEEYERRTQLERLRSAIFSGSRIRTFTFRTNVADCEWLTLVFVAPNDCSTTNPWCVAYARRETFETLPAVTLRESYDRDYLTDLYNFGKYKHDVDDLASHGHSSFACVYFDLIGLHEINNHLGHVMGDEILKDVAEELKLRFPEAFVYRLGGDEFLVMEPDYDEQSLNSRVNVTVENLDRIDIDISYGVAFTDDPSRLRTCVLEAEKTMFENKRSFYAEHKGDKQERVLNVKLEEILQESKDVEACLSMFLPGYTGVYVVNMLDDTMRCIRAPEGFRKYADQPGMTFSEAAKAYTKDSIQEQYQPIINRLFDYDSVRHMLWSGQKIVRYYERKDGVPFDVRVFPYSRDNSFKDYALWVFSIHEDND